MPNPQETWDALVAHIEANYYKPDMEALAVTLSVATAHYFRQDEPVWLMIVGNAGSGKTSICIESVLAMPYSMNIDSLTPQTFLSGFQSGLSGNNSLLHQIGTEDDRSGIFTFADFSSFLGIRDDSRREIASQMRKIYDGYLDRPTGVGMLEWEGKVTIIAAATAGAERVWNNMKELGERFMVVRWPRGDGVQQAIMAFKQIGREHEIKNETARLVGALTNPKHIRPAMVDTQVIELAVAHLAEICALSRAKVDREHSFKREIIGEPEPEGPTRIMKAMAQVAIGHAAMFERREPNVKDFRLARRLGLDSIPPSRLRVIQALRYQHDMSLGWANIQRATGMPGATVTWTCDELEALGILELEDSAVEKRWRIRDEFAGLLQQARVILDI